MCVLRHLKRSDDIMMMSQQEVGNYYLSPTNSGVMNTMMGSEQQLEIRHEYLMTVRTHAPTTVTQTLTSTEYQFKILYLTLNSITVLATCYGTTLTMTHAGNSTL